MVVVEVVVVGGRVVVVVVEVVVVGGRVVVVVDPGTLDGFAGSEPASSSVRSRMRGAAPQKKRAGAVDQLDQRDARA